MIIITEQYLRFVCIRNRIIIIKESYICFGTSALSEAELIIACAVDEQRRLMLAVVIS